MYCYWKTLTQKKTPTLLALSFYQFFHLLLNVYWLIIQHFPKGELESHHHPFAWWPKDFSCSGQSYHLSNHPYVLVKGFINIQGQLISCLCSVEWLAGYLSYFCPLSLKKNHYDSSDYRFYWYNYYQILTRQDLHDHRLLILQGSY